MLRFRFGRQLNWNCFLSSYANEAIENVLVFISFFILILYFRPTVLLKLLFISFWISTRTILICSLRPFTSQTPCLYKFCTSKYKLGCWRNNFRILIQLKLNRDQGKKSLSSMKKILSLSVKHSRERDTEYSCLIDILSQIK